MKISELFEAADAETFEPIVVTDNGAGKFTIKTTAKRGPTLSVIAKVYMAIEKRKDLTAKSLSGLPLSISKVLTNKPSGFVVIYTNPEGGKEKLEAYIESAKAKVEREVSSAAKLKASAPERKKEASKHYAARRKEDIAAYDKAYGKGTWNRVTYKQEGGDDGYQYVVRVDGRVIMNGLNLRSAEHQKSKAVIAIAKKEKLGQFAETK